MKTGILAVAGLCWVVLQPCQAETPAGWDLLKISTGKEYRSVKVSAVEPDGLRITHADGVARVPYEQLPAEIREAFAFDPAKAELARVTRAKATADGKRELREKMQLQSEERKSQQRLENLEWVNRSLRVHQVLPDGALVCYKHNEGGAPGAAARAVGALVVVGRRPLSLPGRTTPLRSTWRV
ncbi:hypothetical protein [Verrucomicrobium spinosum]|uniref:hypothetical protein n=1 Tax=Verrucomicrobium spinosum TaxID=2736 RepID=UPI00094661CE|nr:hypothetical protein [Verrucomicrobium spinosum]